MNAPEVRLPGPLDLSGNKAENWKRFREDFDIFLISTEKEGKKDSVKIALLLNCAGRGLVDIFNTLTLVAEDKKKFDKVVEGLDNYFEPKKYITYERHMFFTRVQHADEAIDDYVTDLRIKARDCNFGPLHDEMIRDRVICGIISEQLRSRLLRQGDVTLDKVLEICRSHETSESQLKEICKVTNELSVNTARSRHESRPRPSPTDYQAVHDRPSPKERLLECKYCGYKHVFGKNHCPAASKKCLECGVLGHFRKKCQKSKAKKKIMCSCRDDDSGTSEDFTERPVGHLHVMKINRPGNNKSVSGTSKVKKESDDLVALQIQEETVLFQMDTGAEVSVLPNIVYKKFKVKPELKNTHTYLVAFTGDRIKPIGKCSVLCLHNGKKYQLTFYVVDAKFCPLLSKNACQMLGVIKICNEIKPQIDDIDGVESLVSNYPDVFEGLGCLAGDVRLEIDKSICPVAHAPRRVPVALKEKLKEELDTMVKNGVIIHETEPTDWVNSIVVVDKGHKLRICLDPKDLNKALKRQHYPLPTIEEVSTRLAGAKIFSVLDATKGFWQLKVDQDSSKLLTFNTCFGRYRYLRLPFGISPAPEIYQRRMHEMFDDIEGVEIIMDDILVHGRTESEHDARLKEVLLRCRDKNLKLNPKKIKLRTNQVKYIGHILSENGIHTDPEKVETIVNFPAPKDKLELQRFLGMINYLSKFIPNMSKLNEPLRTLLEKDVEFQWNNVQEDCFNALKELVTNAPVLQYYDVSKPIVLSVDASSFALGACLFQEGRPVAYAGKSLTKTQVNYAQIEKELLAIVFGAERFHTYVYGRDKILVESDHKPLEAIFRKPLSSAPLRLQKMLLRLQKYNIEVVYKKGSEMYVADAISRVNWPEQYSAKGGKEFYVNSLVANSFVYAELSEFREVTERDPVLQMLKETTQSGWPEVKTDAPVELHAYWSFRHEISCDDGLLFKLGRVVVPRELRSDVLKEIHKSHQGLEKSLRFARDLVFWPGMTAEVKDLISSCDTCNSFNRQQPKEPMIPHEVPLLPWSKLGADLFEWSGKSYLLLVDYYSKYFEFNILENTLTSTVISFCKSQFARHGIPQKIHSDNGPQFVAKEFKSFCRAYGITHTTSSPYYPRSNGLAEKSIQTLKKLLTKAKKEGTDPYLSVLDYRNTPIVGDASPAQLLFGRRTRTTLPTAKSLLKPKVYDPLLVSQKIQDSQDSQKYYYDKHARELPKLEEGEVVRMRDSGSNKKEWKKAVVVAPGAPRSYVVRDGAGQMYKRNRQHLIRKPEKEDTVQFDLNDPEIYDDESVTPDVNILPSPLCIQNENHSEYRTTSGRVVRKPDRLNL